MTTKVLVAGDRQSAGKSTVSLGLLAALLDNGYKPSELAYIKPATQCVTPTLTARFCESKGILYRHIGPVVFYKGFTRQFLDGKAGTSAELVAGCAAAVDRVAAGRKVVVIDGVGYPSVGSIVGCSSADIAEATGANVLLVGKPGVGDAIDSYNLCAAFFEARGLPVLGAVFNKLPETGSYSRAICSEYVRKYFDQKRPSQRVYGMLPLQGALAKLAAETSCGLNFKHPDPTGDGIKVENMSDEEAGLVASLSAMFQEHVDVPQLLADLKPGSITTTGKRFPSSCDAGEGPPVAKKPKADTSIDRFTEFEGNTDYDRFALYLRPLDLDVASNASAFQSAFDSQEKWGGLHVTLCAFAPKLGSGAPQAHPTSLVKTMKSVHASAVLAAKNGKSSWKLSNRTTLPPSSNGDALRVLGTASGDSDTLKAIADAVAAAGLLNARAAKTLHLSIGDGLTPRNQEDMRSMLRRALRWELSIAKCAAGVTPLQVTEFRESMELKW